MNLPKHLQQLQENETFGFDRPAKASLCFKFLKFTAVRQQNKQQRGIIERIDSMSLRDSLTGFQAPVNTGVTETNSNNGIVKVTYTPQRDCSKMQIINGDGVMITTVDITRKIKVVDIVNQLKIERWFPTVISVAAHF